jgi:hypothetical protein
MSYLSAIGSLYLQNGSGAGQTIAEVLDLGNDAGGLSLIGISDCNVDVLNVSTNINAENANCILNNVLVNGGLNVSGNILTDGSMTSNSAVITTSLGVGGSSTLSSATITNGLTISGNNYPVLGSPPLVYPSVGGIRVNQLSGIILNNPEGVPVSLTIAYQKGIYTGKTEIDIGIYIAGGITLSNISGFCTVEVFQGSTLGTLIGYSKTIIGNGQVVSTTVPFFVNILNDGDILTFRITCNYDNTGLPVWKISSESDVDVLRIF